MQSTDESHFCETILVFLCFSRCIGEVVITILNIEVQTGIDSTNHGIRSRPVSLVHLLCLCIIPNPPCLVCCQLITIPNGTIESGGTCVNIFHIGVTSCISLSDECQTSVAFGEHTILIKGCRRVWIKRFGIQILHTGGHTQSHTYQCEIFCYIFHTIYHLFIYNLSIILPFSHRAI